MTDDAKTGGGKNSSGKKLNRLAKEKSPYLLQHAYNPVDWYPWGNEAIERAVKEDKPILLSIGYSSCHWCHVMEHETFEDQDIAELMNANFVCIKVDREERPDVDEIYMKAVMSMTGSGGWPLNVFLTPKLEPFFGGTYFPPISRKGMPGFAIILRSVAQAWKSDKSRIVDSASKMRSSLIELYSTRQPEDARIDESVFDDCYNDMTQSFDGDYGGFGHAPKFPTPSNILFLLRYYKRTGQKYCLRMVTKTLDAMAQGGIYDQIGGGFHRYSTDRFWLVPHFEKMLYDNALLSIAYSEAFLLTKSDTYARIVNETLTWVMREMVSAETQAGYCSAQDADSPEGEGTFYVWNRAEVEHALKNSGINSSDELSVACKYYNITNEGNSDNGKSILTSTKSPESMAVDLGLSTDRVLSMIDETKRSMLQERNKRPKPMTDDKILTSWNGLMISAMSKAHRVFNNDSFLESARRAAEFVLSRLAFEQGGELRLHRRFRDGEVMGLGTLEDYAFLANGLIDLYESTFEPKFLRSAISIAQSMVSAFYDVERGGFFLSVADSPDLIARPKEAYDGAIPSGNSIGALVLLRLSEFTARQDLRDKAESTIKAFWENLRSQPSSFTGMLIAIDFLLGKPKEIVIAGDPKTDATRALIGAVRSEFLPNSVTLLATSEMEALTPLVEGRVQDSEEAPKVYVCSDFLCKLPSSSKEGLLESLSA